MNAQEWTLGQAGKRVRKRMAHLYPSLRDGEVNIKAESTPVPEALDDVMFASKLAQALAERAGLTWSSFSYSEQGASSERGYTAADVRAVIKERDD